ncbi:hypothetical protein Poli38472_013286 [Pythium oligandrum]|uniref:Tyrosine-protein kinase ephrin type A/B receptor-like domain-containing protein n=1 Tax=Pythium oligandrum TaxID=41045 RepID=A0A8K1F9N1_PYTOL|nr:hypothetical protein Poli38472_013286 [Pythium oligandrum]|eukprot:TMW55395.1 hypothetical protein Poli38472_013286 [Pythium oligandrum]
MTRLGLVVVVSTLLLHAVSVSTDSVDPTLLEGQCTRFETAQNASYVSTWRSLNDGAGGSYTRVSHSAVALTNPDRVLIIGGIEYESAQPVVVNTTIVYDVAADAFKLPKDQILSSTAPPPSTTKKTFDEVFVSPASRVEHASFVYENAVFVFGGQTKEFRNDSWRLCVTADSTQAQWDELVVPSTDVVSLAASPSPRIGHSVATVFANASFIGALVYGGLSADYVELGSLHLALISKTSVGCGDRSPRIYWRTLNVTGVSPSARSYHSATTVSRRFSAQKMVCLFVFGGKNLQQNQILGDMWRLCPTDTSTGSIESQMYVWEQITPIGSYNPGPRHSSAIAFIDDGKVAIAGGSYTFPNDFLRDMWEFNINATQWLSIRFDSDFLPPRRGHSITLITSKQQIFLFGGKDRYNVVKKRMDVTSYVAPYCASGLKITLCEATNTYVCVPCPAGYYLEAGTRRCLACAAGTYSSEVDTVANGNPTAVLYFPSNQTRTIRIRSTGETTVESTFSIHVARSGSLAASLQAQITVKTAASNASAVPTGIFPMAVAVAAGEADTLVTFTTSQFTGFMGSNCRSLTLELVDTSSPSVVSRDSDRTLTLFFDDFNGQDGGKSGRSVTTNYASSSPISTVSAILDRTVPTQIQLRPDSPARSGAVPLNLRIVLDPGIADLASVIALIPAMIAQLQTAFTTAQIRIGLVNLSSSDASTSVYQPLADIVDSLQASPPSSLATLSWSTLAAALSATNQTQWTREDNTQRRFVVVFARPASIVGDFTPVQTALAQAAAFALVILPLGSSPANSPSLPAPYAQVVALSSTNEMPQRVASAFQSRLSSTDKTNVAVSILENPGTIVSSVTVSDIFTVGSQRFPIVSINAQSLSASVTSTSALLSLPGLFQLRIVFLEPGASCLTPSEQLPMDDNVMSGWIGSWHLLTAAEWTRQWKPALNTSVVSEGHTDKSLLRSSRTAVLRMQPATQSSLRVAVQRTYTSTDLPKGLDVVLRGYVRHRVKTASLASVPTCRLALQLTPVNSLEQPFTSDLAAETQPGWSYLLLRSRVPYDVAQFQVLLDCNTTADAPVVEWTTLGLFPDPDMACQCPRGFYYDNGGCLRCPAGSYCVAGMRQRCPLGYFTFGKADHCEKCRDGWICVDGLVRLCEPGTYVSSQSTCVVCPSGYACRNGKKMICPVGTFSLPQASDCQSCPPGTISTSEGASTCSKCPLGATSNFQRDHCVLCDDGEFTTYSAQHPCSSCVAASFSRLVQRETCMPLT